MKADRPVPIQKHRDPPQHAGDMPKTCGNCQHWHPRGKLTRQEGNCHNGISGRMLTRKIDGCAFGFYPSVEKFPLQAGPGGTR
jgi:hypothetical protein